MNDRETYLRKATERFAKLIFKPAGYEVPADVRVSCSLPSSKAFAARKRAIGQCYSRSCSTANVNEVFVSPTIDDSIQVLGTLVHELVHAIDDCKHGHKKEFVRIARAVGLQGKPTQCTAHPNTPLFDTLTKYVKRFGEYPHARLDVTKQAKKQTTRMHKVECECGFIYRCSQKALDMIDWCEYSCPACGNPASYVTV